MTYNEIKNFSTSYNLLPKSINQVIQYFLTNCFTFLTKFCMLQVRKSRNFCHVFPVLFYEWNTIIDEQCLIFLVFVLGIISLKGDSFFIAGDLFFSRGPSFLSKGAQWWRYWFWWGGLKSDLLISMLGKPTLFQYTIWITVVLLMWIWISFCLLKIILIKIKMVGLSHFSKLC